MKLMTFGAALALALLALPFAAACGDDDDDDAGPGTLTKVTLMLEWTPNTNHAGIFLAKQNGWYEEAGIDLEIIEPAQSGVEAAVGSGVADFGISAQEYVIPARAEGVPVVSIAAILQHNTSSLISLTKDKITRPKDLAGKTYGGFGGPLEEPIIKKLVQCDGGDPSAVKFVTIGNTDYLVGLEANQYDFVWIFDGWDGVRATEIAKKDVSTIPFIKYASCIPDWYTPVLITNEKSVKSDPDTVRAFMAATARGYREAIKDPAASAAALLKAAPESDKALVEASAKYLATRYVDTGRPWGTQDESIWTGFQQFLVESKIVAKPIDLKAAYTNEFLPK